MKSISHQFADWVRTQDPDERYSFTDPTSCAFHQFAVANGIPDAVRHSWALPEPLLQPLVRSGTFGDLAVNLAKAGY